MLTQIIEHYHLMRHLNRNKVFTLTLTIFILLVMQLYMKLTIKIGDIALTKPFLYRMVLIPSEPSR